MTAEQRAIREAEERALWEALAAEAGQEQARLAQELSRLQKAAALAPPAAVATIVEHAAEAADALDLDEADTRRLIDAQLRLVGWEVDSAEVSYPKGARPQKGKNLAIAEWPTKSGPADYVLFAGLQPVGVVEASPSSPPPSAATSPPTGVPRIWASSVRTSPSSAALSLPRSQRTLTILSNCRQVGRGRLW